MPRQTIHAKVYNRILGLSGPGPIYTCTKLVATDRRDGAGDFRAEFPASDTRLNLITVKESYLEFEVGGRFFCLGLVERMYTELNDKGKQTVVIMGRDQLGALAENTVGDLSIEFAYDAPAQIVDAADVPNQNFSLSTEGNSITNTPYTRLFAGESALSALSKVAADLGEHFRTPKARLLELVWMGTATPTAPVRLVSSGGPRLHENPDVAVIEHVARDHNAEQLANRIYPYGAGIGAARLTLEHATTSMPTGYTMDTAANYIQNDDQQSLPSVRKSIQKVWNHIGVDVGQVYPIQVVTTALTGATMIIVESIAIPIASGTLLDLNGGGVDFVELSANVSVGANVLNVVATTFDVLDTDTLVYTNPSALEAASRQLAYAALTYLQRVSDPSRMVAYKLTVRGLPDTVTVGMTIPVLSQAPGFNIDDDLIILEITRTVTRQGQMPAVVRVVPVDWFDQGEASSIAATMEEFRVSQAQAQPVAYASLTGVPSIAMDIAAEITGASTDDTIADADVWGYLTGGTLVKTAWSNIKSLLQTAFDAIYAPIAKGVTNGDSHDHSGGDGAQIDHGGLAGLADDDHTQYALLAGRSGGQTINGIASTGYALRVLRDLAAASTDSPVFAVVQDNASDDQAALYVQQDGSGVALLVDAVGTAYNATTGLARFVDDTDREVVIGGLGMFRRDFDNDTGDLRFNFLGYNGGVTRYRDFKVYDGKGNLLLLVDGSTGVISVGSLTTLGASKLGIQAGSSSNDAAVGGVLYKTYANVGNVGTGEDTLLSYSLPANTLSVNGMSLRGYLHIGAVSNANSKNIAVKFGSTEFLSFDFPISASAILIVEFRIIRTGATSQIVSGKYIYSGAVKEAGAFSSGASATLSGAVTVACTGEAVANNDVILYYSELFWDDYNT